MHSQAFQLAPGTLRQLGRQVSQNERRRLDQDDSRVGRVDAAKVAPQDRSRQLGKRARQLHAGRTTADDNNRQQGFAFGWVGGVFGFLKRQQHLAADAQRVIEGFQSRGHPLPFWMAEIAGATAQREHQIIEPQGAFLEEHLPAREVNVHDLIH